MTNKKKEWWSDFFTGLFFEVQCGFHSPGHTQEQAENIIKYGELKPGAKVMDIPCGNGRLTLELASRGYNMTGVDITEPLMDIGRKRSDEMKLAVDWILSDMRKINMENKFDAAFCMGGSFGFFDDAGNAAFVSAVARSLKPGGKFIFEAHIAESLLPKLSDRDWFEVDDIIVLDKRHYDLELGRIDSEWTLIRGDKFEKPDSSIRVYSYRELRRLLEDSGLKIFAAYDAKTMEKFEARSSLLFMIAEK